MNRGLLCFLFLGLWAELVKGRALPVTAELKSIAEDLKKELQSYISKVKETQYLKDLVLLKCNENVTQWNKTSMLADRLLQKQSCVEKLQPFAPSVNICPLITLNQDLLQHLNKSGPGSPLCPTPFSDSTQTPVNSTRTPKLSFLQESMQCIDCWSQQVAALPT